VLSSLFVSVPSSHKTPESAKGIGDLLSAKDCPNLKTGSTPGEFVPKLHIDGLFEDTVPQIPTGDYYLIFPMTVWGDLHASPIFRQADV
jgi:hypothetical protein